MSHTLGCTSSTVIIDGTPYQKNTLAVDKVFPGVSAITVRHIYHYYDPIINQAPFGDISSNSQPFASMVDLMAWIIANFYGGDNVIAEGIKPQPQGILDGDGNPILTGDGDQLLYA